MFHINLHVFVQQLVSWYSFLRQGAVHDQLALHCSPVYSLHNNKVVLKLASVQNKYSYDQLKQIVISGTISMESEWTGNHQTNRPSFIYQSYVLNFITLQSFGNI